MVQGFRNTSFLLGPVGWLVGLWRFRVAAGMPANSLPPPLPTIGSPQPQDDGGWFGGDGRELAFFFFTGLSMLPSANQPDLT